MRRILLKVIRYDIKFHENGNIKCMSMRVNGDIHGDVYMFYENGNIKCMYTYVDVRNIMVIHFMKMVS